MNSNFTVVASSISHPRRSTASGFSLIELLVGLLISIIGSMVIFQVFAVSEAQKRTTTSGSDAQQSGGFAIYQLERLIRGAGSGFSQADIRALWGCQLSAFRQGAQLLPAPSPFPAPFASVSQTVRLVPALIQPGAGSNPDTITMMYGRADTLNTPVPVKGTPTATTVNLSNTVGIRRNDLLLAFESGKPCTIVQATDAPAAPVAPAVVGVLPNPVNLAGSGVYNNATTGLSAYSGSTNVLNLGNAAAGSRPGFQLFGINQTTSQLVAYDLLNLDGLAPPETQPLADNIVNVKAAYGVDQVGSDNIVESFVKPTGQFSSAALSDGSAAAATNLAHIKSIRLAIVARSSLREKDLVTAPTLTLFADTPTLTTVVALSNEERHYRYYVYDVVIPLRNMLLIPSV